MARPRKNRTAPPDPWDGLFAAESDEVEDDAPEPPPLPAIKQPRPVSAAINALGPPPVEEGAVAMAKWGYKLMMLSADEARMDDQLSPAERRQEIRRCIDGAGKLMNDAMRYDVKKLIEEERQQLEAKKRGKAAARTEKAPRAPAGAMVIPFRREGA